MRDGIAKTANKQSSGQEVAAAKKAAGVAPGGQTQEVKAAPAEMTMKEELSANWDKFMVS